MLVEKPSGKVARDAFSRATIPEFWNAPLFPVACKNSAGFSTNCVGVSAYHRVGALLDGNRTFGILAQCQTGYAKRRRFFLQTAGIRQNDACAGYQAKHLKVALWWQEHEVWIVDEVAQTEAFDVGPGPWVQGEDQWELVADFVQNPQQRGEGLRLVNIRWAMKRHNAVALQSTEHGGVKSAPSKGRGG